MFGHKPFLPFIMLLVDFHDANTIITVALTKPEDEKLLCVFSTILDFLVIGETLNEYDVSVTSLGNR